MIRLWMSVLALLAGLAGAAVADPMADLRDGNALFREGKYDAAVEAYTRAIMSGELGADALAVTFNNRGVAYGELGDFDRAILDYNEALGLRPDDPTSIRNLRVGHVRRGAAAANLGEQDKAYADFTKAIELDPSHHQAYLRRGQIELERGRLDSAIADFERARSLAPDNEQSAELLAQARRLQAEAARPPLPVAGPALGETPAGVVGEAVEPAAPATEPPAEVAATPAEAPAAAPAAAPPAVAAATPGDGRRVRAVQGVNMRAGPGNSFERVRVMDRGTEGTVVGEQRGWLELELRGGRRGWVYERFVEPVAP